MSSPSDEEMTPELRRALAELPRECDAGKMLEERTVRALRAQGLLSAGAPRRLQFPAAWIAAEGSSAGASRRGCPSPNRTMRTSRTTRATESFSCKSACSTPETSGAQVKSRSPVAREREETAACSRKRRGAQDTAMTEHSPGMRPFAQWLNRSIGKAAEKSLG